MIYIFQRHCNSSSNSVGKNRPTWFSRENCFKNLQKTIDFRCNLNILFDGDINTHFLNNYQNLNVKTFKGGDDARSFMFLLEYVKQYIKDNNLKDDDILYFLEDDYMHVMGWVDIMLEVFNSVDVDYVTLYDHKDKYFLPMYSKLQTFMFHTEHCHWRTTPSTTNTYAMKVKTFLKHYNIHVEYCDLQRGFTRDHDKFTALWQIGSNLVSSIPGYSTHCEIEYMSPVIDWSNQ